MWLALRDDRPVEREVHLGRERLAQAGLAVLDSDASPEARQLRRELEQELEGISNGVETSTRTQHETLRARIVDAQRAALLQLRARGEIGDTAFHRLEARLDIAELHAQGEIQA